MKKHKLVISLTVLLFCASPCLADGETSRALANVARQASGSLAILRYTVEQEGVGRTVTAAGQAICIDAKGMFMTTAIDPRIRPEALKDFELIVPGVERKTVKAKLLGIDTVSGLGFVEATEPHSWKAIKFQRTSNLKVGQLVISAGMMQNDQRLPIYVGAAHVSVMLRTPERLAYVTGGNLTGICSPVFTADGKVIGIVGRNQPYLSYQTLTGRGAVNLPIRGRQETVFFTPVEEFVHVFGNIPTSGQIRRPPWIGVRLEALSEQTAKLKNLVDKPGVMIAQVFPGHPAADEGLKDRDIILGFNGKQIERMVTPELTLQNFEMQLLRFGIGESVTLEVMSGETKRTVKVKLTAMPTLPGEAKRLSIQALGLVVREKVALDRHLEKGPMAEMDGLIIVGVVKNSPAERDGLQKDDLVLSLNDSKVMTVAKFKEIMESALKTSPSKPLEFVVQRGNQAQRIKVRPPAPW